MLSKPTILPQVIVAMITSNMSRASHKSRITILLESSQNKKSGLQTEWVIVTDNLATVQQKFIGRVLGNLRTMTEVEMGLAHTFGLNLAE